MPTTFPLPTNASYTETKLTPLVRVDAGAKAFDQSLGGPSFLTSTILLILIIIALFFIFTLVTKLLTASAGTLAWGITFAFNTLLAIAVLILILLIIIETIDAITASGVSRVVTIQPPGTQRFGDLILKGRGKSDLQEIQVATALAALFYVALVVLPFWWRAYSDRKKEQREQLESELRRGGEGEGDEEEEAQQQYQYQQQGPYGGAQQYGGREGSGSMEESSLMLPPGYPGPTPMPPPYPPQPALRWAQELNEDRTPWAHPQVLFAGRRRKLRRINLEDVDIGGIVGPPPQGGFYNYPAFGWPGMQQAPSGPTEEEEEEESVGKKILKSRITRFQRGFWMIMIWFLLPLILATILAVLLASFRGIRNIRGLETLVIRDVPVIRGFSGDFSRENLEARFASGDELAACRREEFCDENTNDPDCRPGTVISQNEADNVYICLEDVIGRPVQERRRGITTFLDSCLRQNTDGSLNLATFVNTCSRLGEGTGEVYSLATLFNVLVWLIVAADFIGLFWNTSLAPILLFWFGPIIAVAALIMASIGIAKVSGSDTIEYLLTVPSNTGNRGNVYVGAYESSRAVLTPVLILFFVQVVGTALLFRPQKLDKEYDTENVTVTRYLVDPLGTAYTQQKNKSKERKEKALTSSGSQDISSTPEKGNPGQQGAMGEGMMDQGMMGNEMTEGYEQY